jgi:hypothetical protein
MRLLLRAALPRTSRPVDVMPIPRPPYLLYRYDVPCSSVIVGKRRQIAILNPGGGLLRPKPAAGKIKVAHYLNPEALRHRAQAVQPFESRPAWTPYLNGQEWSFRRPAV